MQFIPLVPDFKALLNSIELFPIGVIAPTPVTTTLFANFIDY